MGKCKAVLDFETIKNIKVKKTLKQAKTLKKN